VTSQLLDILDEMPGRVGGKIGLHICRVRQAPAAIALIEQDDAIGGRVAVTARGRGAARPWSAVEIECSYSIWIAASLLIETLPVANIKEP
jgi:hypothetical protein